MLFRSGKLHVDLGVALPGETKKLYIPMTSSEDACSKIYQETTEISDIEIDYRGSAFPQHFSYADTTDLYFPARDLKIESFICDKEELSYGDKVGFTVTFQNGIYPSEEVRVSLFGVFNRTDTVEVDWQTFGSMAVLEVIEHTFEYILPDTLANVEFFAAIDRNGTICEFCEDNNEMSLSLPLDVPMTVVACDDIEICKDSCSTLSAEIIGGIEPYSVRWSPEKGISNPTSLETEICLKNSGIHDYILTVSDANEYVTARDTVMVRVRNIPALTSRFEEYDFGELEACESSTTEDITLINSGGEDIYIDSIYIDSEDFFYVEPALPLYLDKGERKDIRLKFAPGNEGESSASAYFYGGPCLISHSISLYGEKMEMLLDSRPSGIDFGETLCGGASLDTSITMENKGTDDILIKFSEADIRAPFSLLNPTDDYILEPGKTLEVRITYETSNSGEYTSALEIPYETGDCQDEASISLRAVHAIPNLHTSVKHITFPVLLGCETSIDTTIQVLNTGNVDLNITAVEPGDIFSIEIPFSVPAGETKDIEIKFSPNENGKYEGELNLLSEPCDLVNIIAVKGEKQGIAFNMPDTLYVGDLIYCRNNTISNTFLIENNSDGDNSGEIASFNISGPFSTDMKTGDEILSGSEREFSVSFKPYNDMQDGEKTGKLDVLLSPCKILKTMVLKAEKYDAAFVGGKSLDLGLLVSGNETEGIVEFRNTGSTEITVDHFVAPEQPFSIVRSIPELPARLDPQDILEVTVRYSAMERGEFTEKITAVTSEPCELSASVDVMGTCKTVAKTSVAIGSGQAKVGEEIIIPIKLISSENMLKSGITSFDATIKMNASILKPINGTPNGNIENGFRYITLENIDVNTTEGDLMELNFLAVLGDSECTDIELEEFSWIGGEYELQKEAGQFCLTDLCKEGGTRLVKTSNPVYLYECMPNPVKNDVEFRFETIEKAPTTLYIVDMMGNRLHTVYEGMPLPGEHAVKFNTNRLQNGVYMYILQTPSHKLSRTMTIVK